MFLVLLFLWCHMTAQVSGFSGGAGTCDVDISDTSYMSSYPRGAPGDATFEFKLSQASKTTWAHGERISLVYSGAQFTGVLLYFEDSQGNRHGTFDLESHSLLHVGQGDGCFDDPSIATHNSARIKQAPFAVTWIAPSQGDVGTLTLRSLFLGAESPSTFYPGVSLSLSFDVGGGLGDCEPSVLQALCLTQCGTQSQVESCTCIANQPSIVCTAPTPATAAPSPATQAPSPLVQGPTAPSPVPTPYSGTPSPTPLGASRTLCEVRPDCTACLVPGVDDLSDCNWCTFGAVPGGVGECTTKTKGCSTGLQHYGIQTTSCSELQKLSDIELLDVPCHERIQLQGALSMGEYAGCDGCFMSRLKPGVCGWCLFDSSDPAAHEPPAAGGAPGISPAGVCLPADGGAALCQMAHPGGQWSSQCPRCAARVCETCQAEPGCSWCRGPSPDGSESHCFVDSGEAARTTECTDGGGVVFDYTSYPRCPATGPPTGAPTLRPTPEQSPTPQPPNCEAWPEVANADPVCQPPLAFAQQQIGTEFELLAERAGACSSLVGGGGPSSDGLEPWRTDPVCAQAIAQDGRECAAAVTGFLCAKRCVGCGGSVASPPCANVCTAVRQQCPTAAAPGACLQIMRDACLSLGGAACNNHGTGVGAGTLPESLERVFATTPSPTPGSLASAAATPSDTTAANIRRGTGVQEEIAFVPWYVFLAIALGVLVFCAGGLAVCFFLYARSATRAEERAFEKQTIALDSAEQQVKAAREARRKQPPTLRVGNGSEPSSTRSSYRSQGSSMRGSRRSSRAVPVNTLRGHAIRQSVELEVPQPAASQPRPASSSTARRSLGVPSAAPGKSSRRGSRASFYRGSSDVYL